MIVSGLDESGFVGLGDLPNGLSVRPAYD